MRMHRAGSISEFDGDTGYSAPDKFGFLWRPVLIQVEKEAPARGLLYKYNRVWVVIALGLPHRITFLTGLVNIHVGARNTQ